MNGKIGSNWFDDDPEWQELKRRVDNTSPPKLRRPAAPKPDKTVLADEQKLVVPKKVQFAINLTVPRFKLPRPTRKQMSITGLAFVVIIVGLVGSKLWNLQAEKRLTSSNGVLSEMVSEPEFDTVLPEGKKEETSSKELGYDAERKVASYTDQIGTVNIVISQQPLPEAFKSNPDDEVEKMAKSLSANEVIQESNPKAYLGTSAKGPQTVIFHKNGLLVFIQSASKLDKGDWATYITKLL